MALFPLDNYDEELDSVCPDKITDCCYDYAMIRLLLAWAYFYKQDKNQLDKISPTLVEIW